MARENGRTGDTGWDFRRLAGASAAFAFADAASVAPGDSLGLHVASATGVSVDWYRLGWYGGAGGRRVRTDRGVTAAPAGRTAIDPATGRAEAPYPAALSVPIPADWPSGQYVAIVRPSVGVPGVAPFVVRAPSGGSIAPVLFVSAATTWQAYNAWGGADFYTATRGNRPTIGSRRYAVEISFDRPHQGDHGAGYLPRWELPFVRWQERAGRAVDYCADVDLELHPEIVDGRRLLVFAGHHEYWSRPMRATLERAVASGVNVAFLSANEVYWQVRFEPSPLGPARRVICYKSAALDPLSASHPELTTTRWRDQPVNEPEATVVGQMYGHIVQRVTDWVVAGSSHWLYEGTKLRDGDHIANLIGQEYDTYWPAYGPPGTTILARSPVVTTIGKPPPASPAPSGSTPPAPVAETLVHNATIYTAESGATVFAAGTFQWSWALDAYGDRSYKGVATPLDKRIARMTSNLFDRLGDGPA